ncbi:hypothetical protein D918_02283 [Trichuris suis]|nr:hypothetical protein D918_02283 [Trichuris suis]
MNAIMAFGGVSVGPRGYVRFGAKRKEVCAADVVSIKLDEKDFVLTFNPLTRCWTAAWKWSDSKGPDVLRNKIKEYAPAASASARTAYKEELQRWIESGWLVPYDKSKYGPAKGLIPLMAVVQRNKKKRTVTAATSSWDEAVEDGWLKPLLNEIAARVSREDPVRGRWDVSGNRARVWVDASALAIGAALEVDGSIVEDSAWLRPNDARHINMAELDAVIKGLNLALSWKMRSIELMTDSSMVFRWISDGLSGRARLKTKAANELLIRRREEEPKDSPYAVGDKVWVKPPAVRCDTRFQSGTVTGTLSRQAVIVNETPRHVRDLRRRSPSQERRDEQPRTADQDDDLVIHFPGGDRAQTDQAPEAAVEGLRRSTRIRRPRVLECWDR